MSHLEPIIGPAAQLEQAGLDVVGEVLDVDNAGGLPEDLLVT